MPVVELTNKELGLILTPPATADYIVSRLGNIPSDAKILDPCVGPGVFVRALLKKGVDPRQITAFDISGEHRAAAEEMGVRFVERDTLLDMNPLSFGEYDFIVGNPPYLSKASSYIRVNRRQLRKMYGDINAHEAYAMFLINSVRRVREGGRIAFVTSDSFMTLNTHERLRRYLLRNCKIDELCLAPRDLFGDQRVSTSPAILVLTKCVGREREEERLHHSMRIVGRLGSEEEYKSPEKVFFVEQKSYWELPYCIFFVDIEESVLRMFRTADRLEDHIKGYIGMHTTDNARFIAPIDTLPKDCLEKGLWKPYLKRGGREQYLRPIKEAVRWDDESKKEYHIPIGVPFGEEGLVVSGVSSRLSARYMPRGCHWDSNKAIGFFIVDDDISIEYALGLLNSSLYNYLAKEILNKTNCLQLTDLHTLPFTTPDKFAKERVESLVSAILEGMKRDCDYDYSGEQRKIDEVILDLYQKRFGIAEELRKKLST